MPRIADGIDPKSKQPQHAPDRYGMNGKWTDMDVMDMSEKPSEKKAESNASHFLVRYSQESSFSGLKYIGESGSFLRRFLWLLIVLLALSGLVFQIYNCTAKFIARPTSTKLSYIEKDELDFPSVTICNANMFSQTQLAAKYGGYAQFYAGLNELRNVFPARGLGNVPEVPLPDEYPPGNVSLYDFIRNNALTLEETLLGCEFNREPCVVDNFTTTVTNYGVCFTFNAIDLMQTSLKIQSPGQLQGLSLLLNGNEGATTAAPRQYAGFKLLLHRRDELPYNMQDFGIELDLGKHTSVRIEPREVERLAAPYGPCLTEGSGTLTYLSGNYTKSKCFLECETETIVSKCKCRSYYMPGDAPYCNPHELVECFYPSQKLFSANKHSLCSCRDICVETKYGVSISQTTFPSSHVAYVLRICDQDYTFEKWAFIQGLSGRTQPLFTSIGPELWGVTYGWYQAATNHENVTSTEAFPLWFGNGMTQIFSQLFVPLQTDIQGKLLVSAYDQVNQLMPTSNNISYGSPLYLDAHQQVANQYLHSGLYKSIFTAGLEEDYNSLPETNVTFEEFAGQVYEDFSIEEGFYAIEAFLYQKWHDELMDLASNFYLETDLYDLTTKWLRKNSVFVDIYFGDMEVESVVEQKDYEIFQFICDCGGALGLFFGASLLSFIETIDFTFRDIYKVKPSSK